MAFYFAFFFISSIAWLLWLKRKRGDLSNRGLFVIFFTGLIAGPVAGSITHLIRSAFQIETGRNLTENFFVFFLLVGPIEEAAKFLAAFLVSHRRSDFKTSSDGIVASAAAALGFAAGENILYLNVYGIETTFLRPIFANAAHVLFSVIWGYALGVVLHESAAFSFLIVALVIASILHGAYDFFLLFHSLTAFLMLFLMVPGMVLVFQFLKNESLRNRKR